MLVQLGDDEHSVVRAIFQNVNTSITQAKNLTKLVKAMDSLDWYNEDETASRDDFGDMYEGLLQKNANETKSGAGQYFTPPCADQIHGAPDAARGSGTGSGPGGWHGGLPD